VLRSARRFGRGVALGKPYRSELNQLSETFDWARRQDLKAITKALDAASFGPILAIGSGGSMAAADYLTVIHTHLSGHLSTSQTPLEFLRSEARMDELSVWLLSAGGKNIDILRTIRRAIQLEPAHLAVFCASSGSPLAKIARPLAIDVLEYEPPAGKDGFLATNSLASFLLLLARAYTQATGASFVSSLPDLLEAAAPHSSDLFAMRKGFAPLLDREHWLVLYDPGCRPIASDMESRFTEAALGSIKASDIRNFAHGRHHWLAKRGSTSAVIVLSQPSTTKVAMKSLDLLPRSLPRVHLQFSDNPILAPVGGIFLSMEITGWVGEARGIDPGRPGVPEFGRRLYNLTTKSIPDAKIEAAKQIVVRKARITTTSLRNSEIDKVWEASLDTFYEDLYRTPIRGIVFDYDGTLVEVQDRFDPPKPDISSALTRLLAAEVRIGIATGRGRSARRDLQKVIPREFWPHILIGYHNGAELGPLEDDTVPDSTNDTLDPVISRALELLEEHQGIWQRLTVDRSHSQLSLQWKSKILGWKLRDLLEPMLPALRSVGVRLVTSGHSMDLLAPGVSKKRVVTCLGEKEGFAPQQILAIGDRGRAPGNDAEMLSHRPSLSVDEVSDDASTCWRLTPPMLKGPPATLWYLDRLSERKKHPGTVVFKKGSLRA
jgi:HAD superfamily hydrolase (TIGR01484 family)